MSHTAGDVGNCCELHGRVQAACHQHGPKVVQQDLERCKLFAIVPEELIGLKVILGESSLGISGPPDEGGQALAEHPGQVLTFL